MSAASRRTRLLALLAIAAWTVSQTAGWNPSTQANVLVLNIDRIWFAIGAGYLDPWKLVLSGAGWLAVAMTMTLPLRRAWLVIPGLVAFSLAVLVFRMMLPGGGSTTPELLLTLPAALFVSLALAASAPRNIRAAIALGAAVTALLAHQLRPAYGGMPDFGWSTEFLAAHPELGLQLLAFHGWFAFTMVLAGHALAARPGFWALAATGTVVLSEWAQLGMPGRMLELAPVVVVAVAGGLGALLVGAGRGTPTMKHA
jgi:hypothetical protein